MLVSVPGITSHQHAQRFQIELEKDVYFPGELVKGNLIVETTTDLKCRGIRIGVQGEGYGHCSRGKQEDRKDYYNRKYYCFCIKTMWGKLHKTPVIEEAGENALFGSPWSPDEGVMDISIPITKQVALP